MSWIYSHTITSEGVNQTADYTYTNNSRRPERLFSAQVLSITVSRTISIDAELGGATGVILESHALSGSNDLHSYITDPVKYHVIQPEETIILNTSSSDAYRFELNFAVPYLHDKDWHHHHTESSSVAASDDFTYTNNTQRAQRASAVIIRSVSGSHSITLDGQVDGNTVVLETFAFSGSSEVKAYVTSPLVNHIIKSGETLAINEASTNNFIYEMHLDTIL